MISFKEKAREIYDALNLEEQRLLTYFAGKNSQTPLEFIEAQLKAKASLQNYCQAEGLDCKQVSRERLQHEADSIQQQCEKLQEMKQQLMSDLSEILQYLEKNKKTNP